MTVRKKNTDAADALADIIIHGMEEKKAKNILKLDMRQMPGAVADIFLVCHGESDKQVEAIARSIEETVEEQLKESPWHKEGFENCEWVLLDYINVVAHIFVKDKREFFGLEQLWGDAVITSYGEQEQ